MPPCRRLETLGLPSLSTPPDTVSPRVVPSFFISSTKVEPLNSSVEKEKHLPYEMRLETHGVLCVRNGRLARNSFHVFFFSLQFAECLIKIACRYSIVIKMGPRGTVDSRFIINSSIRLMYKSYASPFAFCHSQMAFSGFSPCNFKGK